MSNYLNAPIRELEDIAADLRLVIERENATIVFLEGSLEVAKATRLLAEQRMEAIQEAIVHRVRAPTVVRFPTREPQDHVVGSQWGEDDGYVA
jgi:hypothetical protein